MQSLPHHGQQFWQTASGQRYGVGQFFAYDATSLRLRELSIGYDIPWHSAVIKSMRIQRWRVTLFWIYRGNFISVQFPNGKRKMWMGS